MGLDGCVSESWKLRGATHSALTGPYGHARVIFGDHGASDLDYIQAPAFAILRSPTRRYAAPRPSSCRRSDAKNLDRCSFPEHRCEEQDTVLGAVFSRRRKKPSPRGSEQQCVSRHAPPAAAYQLLTDARACAGYDLVEVAPTAAVSACRGRYNLFSFPWPSLPAQPWCLYGRQIEFKSFVGYKEEEGSTNSISRSLCRHRN
jgi:hypothetical protein